MTLDILKKLGFNTRNQVFTKSLETLKEWDLGWQTREAPRIPKNGPGNKSTISEASASASTASQNSGICREWKL